jgi:hypothetical protein
VITRPSSDTIKPDPFDTTLEHLNYVTGRVKLLLVAPVESAIENFYVDNAVAAGFDNVGDEVVGLAATAGSDGWYGRRRLHLRQHVIAPARPGQPEADTGGEQAPRDAET